MGGYGGNRAGAEVGVTQWVGVAWICHAPAWVIFWALQLVLQSTGCVRSQQLAVSWPETPKAFMAWWVRRSLGEPIYYLRRLKKITHMAYQDIFTPVVLKTVRKVGRDAGNRTEPEKEAEAPLFQIEGSRGHHTRNSILMSPSSTYIGRHWDLPAVLPDSPGPLVFPLMLVFQYILAYNPELGYAEG